MRFSYIDRRGREVELASVEDLASRIELGVITPETLLYDTAEDQWGPAESHEVFRELAQEMFAPAPPRPLAGVVELEEPPLPGPFTPPARGDDESVPPDFELADPMALDLDSVGLPPVDAEPEMADDPADLLQEERERFTRDVLGSGEREAGAWESETFEADAFEAEAFEAEEPTAEATELDPFEVEDPDAEASALDPRGGEPDDFDALDREPDPFDSDSTPFQPAPLFASFRDRLKQAETADAVVAAPVEPGERPLPSLPVFTPPARARVRASQWKPIAGTVGLLLLVVVGGIITLRAPDAEEFRRGAMARAETLGQLLGDAVARDGGAAAEDTPVVIPLSPEAEAVVQTALAATLVELERLQAGAGLGSRPGNAWLQGRYLANASSFPEIREYWSGYQEYLRDARDAQPRLFAEAVRAALAGGVHPPEVHDALEAEALGWLDSARPRLEAAFDRREALAEASLELHSYLEDHEREIDYDPVDASGVSRDPVIEAVPRSAAVAEEMWARLDVITDRLEAIQGLGSVSTTGLMESLFGSLMAGNPGVM